MAQKTLISLLVVTIVGAVLIGIYDAVRPMVASDDLTNVVEETTILEEVAQAPVLLPTATAATVAQLVTETEPTEVVQANPVQQQQSLDMVGAPWFADGVITALDDFGMTLNLADGSSVYIELGPPTYWQAQNVPLAVDDSIFVAGFNNGEQVHAATVMLPDGTQITLRNETGQPLWSGGAGGGNVQGQSEPLAQIDPADWVTVSGVITSLTNSTVTLQTADGPMTVQLGQQRFWQNQGVTLAVSDEISVLGIWQSSQFQVAEITKTATGERIMLRDPNNRPLWAGPGSNSQGGSGQSSAGQGQGNGGQGNSGNGGSGQGGNGQGTGGNGGNGGNGQGNGNGYRGGRGSN